MKAFVYVSLSLLCFVACQSSKQSSTDQTTETTQSVAVQDLSQTDLAAKVAEANVVLVDVRTPEEVAQGYITGATTFIDFYSDGFQDEIKKLDKSKTYVMYCRSGGRSGKAAQFMVDNGFKTVYNLNGGISNYTGELAK